MTEDVQLSFMTIPNIKIIGALFLGAMICLSSRAQFAELLLESPLTLSATYTIYTESTALKGAVLTTTTTPRIVKLTHAGVLADLQASGIIPPGSLRQWGLMAVRPTYALQSMVNGDFAIYAKNLTTGVKFRVPAEKFKIKVRNTFAAQRERKVSTEATELMPAVIYTKYEYILDRFLTVPEANKYLEVNQGFYVHSSKGFAKNLIQFGYLPIINIGGTRLMVNDIEGNGYTTISFQTATTPVFYYDVKGQTGAIFGAFTATDSQNRVVTGEYSTVMRITAPKLVAATMYPDVLTQ